ncbi:helix-turn-helix domain-containing protein [Paenibacillus sp. GD4]|uniref:helix-turn-helix domain-containing protein n=1 Tax=Paenibacillus sp. GD4 TaxID=3068890 RepID=UPI00279658AC|nr:helix-turn-helix domain-containing protein [Paenibacillus sp. GD4]MDQ1910549.1 helix-turn-helix domain-containing protein [Paenibacillus sp. GD4]
MNESTRQLSIEYIPAAKRNTLTLKEAWEEVFECQISKDKLYAEVRAKRIPHTRVGTKILFRRDTLLSWFQEQETKNYCPEDIETH